MYTIHTPTKQDHTSLINIWERSVRATHHFLLEEDIAIFKQLIRDQYLDMVNLTCVRNDKMIIGFSGALDGNLEMLFIDPDYRGKGIGKLLLNHAINHLGITKVDVNEQNDQAVQFYVHAGFHMMGRSERDGTGKPYPLLHLALTS